MSDIREGVAVSDNKGVGVPFVMAAVAAPYGVIATAVWVAHDRADVHGVLCIGIFAGLSYLFGRITPLRRQIRIGMFIATAIIFGVMRAFKVDALWSGLWAAVYLGITFFTARAVDRDSAEDEENREGIWSDFKSRLNDEFVGGGSEGAVKTTASERLYHHKVGFCRGTDSTTTTKFRHQLLKCGRCSTAGCAELTCSNRNFQGTRCLTCELMANPK